MMQGTDYSDKHAADHVKHDIKSVPWSMGKKQSNSFDSFHVEQFPEDDLTYEKLALCATSHDCGQVVALLLQDAKK